MYGDPGTRSPAESTGRLALPGEVTKPGYEFVLVHKVLLYFLAHVEDGTITAGYKEKRNECMNSELTQCTIVENL